jgi:plasmid stabilization system protein ParE
MRRIEFLHGAREDFDESFDWYAKRSVRTALRFAGAVDAALASVSMNPTRLASMDAAWLLEEPLNLAGTMAIYRNRYSVRISRKDAAGNYGRTPLAWLFFAPLLVPFAPG